MKVVVFLFAITGLFFSTASAQGEETAYLFASWREEGEDGLHLSYSYDGLTWQALKRDTSFLAPEVGGGLMRDPHIIQGHDGRFHMVWTTGWWENHIGIAHSDDLITWSDQKMLPVMAHEPEVINAWAPEIEWDEEAGEYILFWSSSVPGAFPETAGQGSQRKKQGWDLNHRIYSTTTADFETYTPTQLFYDGGFVAIDATLINDGARTIMVIKDETRYPEAERNLRLAIAADMQGPYGPASPPFSPADEWVEGPTAMKIGDQFYVYFDSYQAGRMGATRSPDLIHWEDISDQVSFPKGSRHGSVLEVDRTVIEALLSVQ